MRRRDLLVLSAAALVAPAACSRRPNNGNGKLRIGFSQATTLEPWRAQFNRDILAEAALHPNVDLIITDGEDRTEKQVADVENLIRQQVDALLISPKESAGLTGVVVAASQAHIPVFVLDRNVDTDAYVQFAGGDNRAIGRAAGEYAVELLGGAGRASGKIVEIWGGPGAQPAHDRHDGFMDATTVEHGLQFLLSEQSADWKQDQAYNIMATAMRNHERIDLVFAHNDPMAYGAYLAAKDAGRERQIRFLGIDGLAAEGARWVADGVLTATFTYPTPGAEGLRQALLYLSGQRVEHTITLPTTRITHENAASIARALSVAP